MKEGREEQYCEFNERRREKNTLLCSLNSCSLEQCYSSKSLFPPAGAYVALTLLGSSPSSIGVSGLQQDPSPAGAPRVTPMIPPPPPPPPLPPPQRITGPKPLQVMVFLANPSLFQCSSVEIKLNGVVVSRKKPSK